MKNNMTQEEKAQAYDEALERFIAFKEKYYTKDTCFGDVIFDKTGEMQKDFKSIFPKLRESEDERIRRCIGMALTDVKEQRFKDYDTSLKDCLSWLEKQKDMNCLACDQHLKGYIAGRKATEDEKQKELPFVKDVMLGYPAIYFYDGERMHFQGNPAMEEKQKQQEHICDSSQYEEGFKTGLEIGLRKQKEQRPNIEICPHSIKSKSYKENGYPIEDCDYGLEIAYDILKKTLGEVRGYQTDDGIREHQTAIEAVRKAQEQKPAEWSEEKEKAVDNYADEIIKWENAHKDWDKQVIRATAYHFFNLQPKQEWSEEDEEIIQSLILKLNEYVFFAGLEANKIVSFLKSLRPQPHWKPSEEQMEALKRAVNKLAKTDVSDSVRLSIMYDNLKKLK